MDILKIDLGSRSYPISIGPGLLENGGYLTPYLASDQVFIITNEIVGPLYLQTLLDALGDTIRSEVFVMADGESEKNLSNFNAALTAMLEAKCNRKTTVIALGGGVVGDLSGFVAASYQRGVPFIQVPTTLLSQVDSSVGGKTGINHALGKNMIGAFYQPQCVVMDTTVLSTLPQRQLVAGIAEVIKYGILWDEDLFIWLEQHIEAVLALEPVAIQYALSRSCSIKAEVVAQDERETGVRALLNLGHTFGHAIENGLGYGQWLHGEAVGLGMVMAADCSVRLGMIEQSTADRMIKLIERAGLPVSSVSGLSAERFRELMELDKKNSAGKLHLVLIKAVGHTVVCAQDNERCVLETIAKYTQS